MNDDKRKLAEVCGLKHEKINGIIHIWIYNTDMADWVAWYPFTNIEQAMMVRDAIHSKLFSIRMRFKEQIRKIISARLGPYMLSYEELILLVTADDICRAALSVLEEG